MGKVLKSFLGDLRPSDAPESFNIFEKPTSMRVLNGFGESLWLFRSTRAGMRYAMLFFAVLL
jgi:hypothetical protein